MIKLYNKNCYGLEEIENNSINSLITDPPYGINFAEWDKSLPDKKIWGDCLRVLKPGAFCAVFSSIRLMHRLMVDLEDSGFLIKDVLMWAFLNGMPKSHDIGLEIDKTLGVESEKIGEYKYVQGYKKDKNTDYKIKNKFKYKPVSELGKKYIGSGLSIKPAYEPIILIQKPISEPTVAENMIKYGTGALNLEETRIPYEDGENKVGHNPHPLGRVMANIIRTEPFEDNYDKFFLIPKVRQHADDYNNHPTIKPLGIIDILINLCTWENETVLDPFTGSGTTGISAKNNNRNFIGYEINENYFNIAIKRLETINKL